MTTNDQPVWTKCSERMPPDDEGMIITKEKDGNTCVIEGYLINRRMASAIYCGVEWTPYSDELWKELNNE